MCASGLLLGCSLGTPGALWLLLAALCLLLAAPAKLLGRVSEAKKMIKFSPKGTGENHRNERRNGSPELIEDTESSARTCFTELRASEHCAVSGCRVMFPNVLQKLGFRAPSANLRPQYVTPQFSLFPKFSSSFLYRKCSTRYLEALRGEGLGCRTPSRTPNLRKQRANVRHHGVIPWVLLGCSWAAPLLLGPSACSWLLSGCSWLLLRSSWAEFRTPRK